MNWLFFIVVGLLLVLGLHGYGKGFIRKAFSLIALFITIALVSVVSPHISSFIQHNTPVYDTLKDKSAGIIFSGGEAVDGGSLAVQEAAIESSYFPNFIKKGLNSNNNSTMYALLEATGFSDYVGGYIAKLIIDAIAFVVAFLIIFIMLRILIKVLDMVAKLPVLNSINRFAGLLLGLVQALVIIWIGFVVITIFSNMGVGRICFQHINDSLLLSILYNYNPILRLIM